MCMLSSGVLISNGTLPQFAETTNILHHHHNYVPAFRMDTQCIAVFRIESSYFAYTSLMDNLLILTFIYKIKEDPVSINA